MNARQSASRYRVVLASDGSPAALGAGRWIQQNFSPTQTEVVVVTVAPDWRRLGLLDIFLLPIEAMERDEDDEWRAVREILETTVARFKPSSYALTAYGVVHCDRLSGLLAAVVRFHPDLLVVGKTRRHGGLERPISGSFTASLSQISPVPVVIVSGAGDEGVRPVTAWWRGIESGQSPD